MVYYLRLLFWALVLLIFGAFLHYSLPQWDVVRVTDTYEKRQDFSNVNRLFWAQADSGSAASPASRDVLFIQAFRPDGDVIVYRNEDTGFSWPLVFKFDTANLQADVTDAKSTKEAPKWVAIKHYGWRITYLSAYPNALHIKPVAGPDAVVIPWTSVCILILIIMVVWAITARWLKFKRRYISPALDRGDAWVDRMWLKLTGRQPAVVTRDEI